MGRSAPERGDPLRKNLQKIAKLEARQAALADRHNALEEELHALNARIKHQRAVVQQLHAAIAATESPPEASYVSLTPQPSPQRMQLAPQRIVFYPVDALPADVVHSPTAADAAAAAAAAELMLDKLPVRVLKRICVLLSAEDLCSLAQVSATLAVVVEQSQQPRQQQWQQHQQQQTTATGTPSRAETGPTPVAQAKQHQSSFLRFLSVHRHRESSSQLPQQQQK